MSSSVPTMAQRRNNLFARAGSPSNSTSLPGRPKSTTISSPFLMSSNPTAPSHTRAQSQSHSTLVGGPPSPANSRHHRAESRGTNPASNTFAPSFIKAESARPNSEAVNGIEGENDFSGKRYVWLKDAKAAFVKGWIVEELGTQRIIVQCDDGSVRFSHRTLSPDYLLTSYTAARSRPRKRR